MKIFFYCKKIQILIFVFRENLPVDGYLFRVAGREQLKK